jgi:hypothetical protein
MVAWNDGRGSGSLEQMSRKIAALGGQFTTPEAVFASLVGDRRSFLARGGVPNRRRQGDWRRSRENGRRSFDENIEKHMSFGKIGLSSITPLIWSFGAAEPPRN